MAARDRLEFDLRTAIVGVLCERLPTVDDLALAIYSADSHARQLAREVTRSTTKEPS